MIIYPTYYTYLVGWSKHNLWYYGRRTSSKCHPTDLWSTYFTSSKEIKRIRPIIGEPDVVQVRRTFASVQECIQWEIKVIRRMKSSKRDNWLNKSHGQSGVGYKPRGSKEKQSTREKKSQYQTGRVTVVEIETNSRVRMVAADARLLVKQGTHRYQRTGSHSKSPTPEQRKRHSEIMKGRTAWNRGVSKPRCCCLSCRVEVDVTNFNRWHDH